MSSQSDIHVLAVAIMEAPSPGFARAALRHGWPVLRMPVASEAYAQVKRRRPRVVLMQVSLKPNGALDLISRLRTDARRISVVAVASVHHEELERAVRNAGAGCYLPNAADVDYVGHVVADLLDRDEPAPVRQVDRYRSPESLSLPLSNLR